MKTIIVVSPDKISLNMFFSFLKSYYSGTVVDKPLAVNSLTSLERNDEILNEYIALSRPGSISVILYKSLKNANLEDLRCLRSDFYEKTASLVFTLDLYSTTPRVLKDRFEESDKILKGWQTFVEKVERGI